ncbi:hypothetical protein PMKS-000453 [Pichia membranifaciens]|uniref:Uncharacterized protein n=1 Tax=Pichia membranifaciens TaxID=4926 RepID=A0A1Q2YBS9_9ASCO|nr:hypothetical protein PMKS-000453 [Pichia membranifaciens]
MKDVGDSEDGSRTEKRKVEKNDFCGKQPCSYGRGVVVGVATRNTAGAGLNGNCDNNGIDGDDDNDANSTYNTGSGTRWPGGQQGTVATENPTHNDEHDSSERHSGACGTGHIQKVEGVLQVSGVGHGA